MTKIRAAFHACTLWSCVGARLSEFRHGGGRRRDDRFFQRSFRSGADLERPAGRLELRQRPRLTQTNRMSIRVQPERRRSLVDAGERSVFEDVRRRPSRADRDGDQAEWSPDGKQIALRAQGSLCIRELATADGRSPEEPHPPAGAPRRHTDCLRLPLGRRQWRVPGRRRGRSAHEGLRQERSLRAALSPDGLRIVYETETNCSRSS